MAGQILAGEGREQPLLVDSMGLAASFDSYQAPCSNDSVQKSLHWNAPRSVQVQEALAFESFHLLWTAEQFVDLSFGLSGQSLIGTHGTCFLGSGEQPLMGHLRQPRSLRESLLALPVVEPEPVKAPAREVGNFSELEKDWRVLGESQGHSHLSWLKQADRFAGAVQRSRTEALEQSWSRADPVLANERHRFAFPFHPAGYHKRAQDRHRDEPSGFYKFA